MDAGDGPIVVVSHSLGTVVAYDVLREPRFGGFGWYRCSSPSAHRRGATRQGLTIVDSTYQQLDGRAL